MQSAIIFAAVLLGADGGANAADSGMSMRGAMVLPKLNAVFKVDGTPRNPTEAGNIPWIVQKVDGTLLWVGDEQKGWVQREHVVTLDEAPEYFTQLIESNQRNAFACYCRALAWEHQGKLDLAIADYGEVLRLEPTAAMYSNRAELWMAKGEDDKAIGDYTEAIRLEPDCAARYGLRGVVWLKKADYDRAIEDFSRAVEIEPEMGIAYSARGAVWMAKKDYDQAISDFSQVIRLNPDDAKAYNNRGSALSRKKKFADAIADFDHVVLLNPKDASALTNAAWLRATCPDEQFRDGKQAVALATRACELRGWKAANNLGVLAAGYAEAGDFDAAIKSQEEAIKLNPNDRAFVQRANDRLALFKDHKPYRE